MRLNGNDQTYVEACRIIGALFLVQSQLGLSTNAADIARTIQKELDGYYLQRRDNILSEETEKTIASMELALKHLSVKNKLPLSHTQALSGGDQTEGLIVKKTRWWDNHLVKGLVFALLIYLIYFR